MGQRVGQRKPRPFKDAAQSEDVCPDTYCSAVFLSVRYLLEAFAFSLLKRSCEGFLFCVRLDSLALLRLHERDSVVGMKLLDLVTKIVDDCCAPHNDGHEGTFAPRIHAHCRIKHFTPVPVSHVFVPSCQEILQSV